MFLKTYGSIAKQAPKKLIQSDNKVERVLMKTTFPSNVELRDLCLLFFLKINFTTSDFCGSFTIVPKRR